MSKGGVHSVPNADNFLQLHPRGSAVIEAGGSAVSLVGQLLSCLKAPKGREVSGARGGHQSRKRGLPAVESEAGQQGREVWSLAPEGPPVRRPAGLCLRTGRGSRVKRFVRIRRLFSL